MDQRDVYGINGYNHNILLCYDIIMVPVSLMAWGLLCYLEGRRKMSYDLGLHMLHRFSIMHKKEL